MGLNEQSILRANIRSTYLVEGYIGPVTNFESANKFFVALARGTFYEFVLFLFSHIVEAHEFTSYHQQP